MLKEIILIGLIFIACSGGGGNPDDNIPEAVPQDYSQYPEVLYAYHDGYADADKDMLNDDKMCWAAAAANALEWTGWEDDADSTFSMFKNVFENEGKKVFSALNYYFKTYIDQPVEAYVLREYDYGKIIDFIASSLNQNKAIIAIITDDNSTHAMSIYGYELKGDEWTNLFFADSNDEKDKIYRGVLIPNKGRWQFQNTYFEGWYLQYVVSLEGENQQGG